MHRTGHSFNLINLKLTSHYKLQDKYPEPKFLINSTNWPIFIFGFQNLILNVRYNNIYTLIFPIWVENIIEIKILLYFSL